MRNEEKLLAVVEDVVRHRGVKGLIKVTAPGAEQMDEDVLEAYMLEKVTEWVRDNVRFQTNKEGCLEAAVYVYTAEDFPVVLDAVWSDGEAYGSG